MTKTGNIIKPLILERLIRTCEDQPCYGVFDFIPEAFNELFPEYHKKGDALSNAFIHVFDCGLRIGFKTGQAMKEIEVEGEEIIRQNLAWTQEAIETDRKRIETGSLKNRPLL